MTIPLGEYARVSAKLCVCYFGSKTDIVKFLVDMRTAIEDKYPGLELHYSFREDMFSRLDYLSEQSDRIIPQAKLKNERRGYGYLMDITRNLEEFFEQIGMKPT
jgi:hypothetical protein